MSDPCQPFQDKVTSLEDQMNALSDLLIQANSPEKADIMKKIKALGVQLAKAEADLQHCRQHPPQLHPQPSPQWESLGPANIPGRISALAIHPKDPGTLYAGSADGGVFKTINGGKSWATTWSQQYALAIGGLAVAPSKPEVIYAATGEWDVSSAAIYTWFPGAGVYRSGDSGANWALLSPITSNETSAVAVDPGNADRVFVAGNRALHRSTDGGASWDVLPGNLDGVFDGVISDVVIDPAAPDHIYVGVHDSNRRSGGVWRSSDGGNTWTLLGKDLPSGGGTPGPRIALGSKGAHGTKFVAVKMGDRVFVSLDGGDNFTLRSQFPQFETDAGRGRNVIAVDPVMENVLFAGDVDFFTSVNAGVTWTQIGKGKTYPTVVHEDLHAIVFSPTSNNHLFVATDGGVYESADHGASWMTVSGVVEPATDAGLVTAQCWTIGVSQEVRLAYGITTHDNLCYASTAGGPFDYVAYFFRSEGGWIQYDPKSADVIYVNTWSSGLVKTTDGQKPWQSQTWKPLPMDSHDLNSVTLAIAWSNTDWLLAIVRGTAAVSRSTDGGSSWNTVLGPGPTITAVRFAPSDDQHAYAASADGRVWHSIDGGKTFTELPRGGLPVKRVHDIQVDWKNPLRIFLAFGDRGSLGAVGYRPLWRGDVGNGAQAAWSDVTGKPGQALPDAGLTGLVVDPDHPNTLYVASVRGIHRSTDGGGSWTPFATGLPRAFVSHLTIRRIDRTLYASTMGRGVFRRVV
jgi:photosystem II stability/assembly factor-like uncharacterized protein